MEIYRFRSIYKRFACYSGSVRVRFTNGQYETKNKQVADKLRDKRYRGVITELDKLVVPDEPVKKVEEEPKAAEPAPDKAKEALSKLAAKK